MQTVSPSRKPSSNLAISLLVACFFASMVNSLGGCAVLSIPSYRADHFPAPDWIQSEGSASEICDSEACPAVEGEPQQCDEANYVPVFPTIPLPKCIQRWKEQRNLPEGPVGLRFHPLPTRPMFAPRPTVQNGIEGQPGCANYGAIPQGAQWIDPAKIGELTNPMEPLNTSSTQPPPAVKQPTAAEPTIVQPTPAPDSIDPVAKSTEELPAPATK